MNMQKKTNNHGIRLYKTNVENIAYRKLTGRTKIRDKSCGLSAYRAIYRHIERFILLIKHREKINRTIYQNIGRYLEQCIKPIKNICHEDEAKNSNTQFPM